LTGQEAEAREALQRYLALPGVATKSIAQLRAQQLALANNPTWVAYNERLFDGLRQAGMPGGVSALPQVRDDDDPRFRRSGLSV
jgi:hypothetical protein